MTQKNTAIHLILIRHGNTFESTQTPTQVGSKTDLPLTSKGRSQAEQVASYLKAQKILPAGIYAGTLARQIETAHIIGKSLGLENALHLNEPALTEIDYGPWEGLTAEEIMLKWSEEYQKWTQQAEWPEHLFGGTLEGHIDAINVWLMHVRNAYKPGETVLGVTSNGLMRLFYSLEKEKWRQIVQARQMENFKVKTGHFCVLELFQDSLKVKTWNQSP